MTTGGSGAVFFLGTRAHYQVLQQPESRFDVENGNASTETIYQNPPVQELWAKEQAKKDLDSSGNYGSDSNWNYCDNDVTGPEEKEKLDLSNVVKRRTKRRPSETALCERDAEMKPALLNNIGDGDTPKSKPSRRRINLLTFLTSLAKRKRKLDNSQIQYLHHLSGLNSCTYRESCRCLECQSRYFECDESEEYSSDDDYSPRYITQLPEPQPESDDDDDEVFVDTVPGDNTSTDLLIENQTQAATPNRQMSVSSSDSAQEGMEIEVAAGTPVLLNYLLTHPITCAVQ